MPRTTQKQQLQFTPLTDAERRNAALMLRAVVEARQRAAARGLTEAEIDREENDVDSQYWEDVAEFAAAQRARRAIH